VLCQHWELVWLSVFCLVPHEVTQSAMLNSTKRLTQLTGNLWYMYAAWWMFLIGLTVTAGLGMAGSGNDDYNKRPSQAEWTACRWTLLGIVLCTLCVVEGFVSFCLSISKYLLAHLCWIDLFQPSQLLPTTWHPNFKLIRESLAGMLFLCNDLYHHLIHQLQSNTRTFPRASSSERSVYTFYSTSWSH
jgi:hypothetical protein